jgi:hypothetical protein
MHPTKFPLNIENINADMAKQIQEPQIPKMRSVRGDAAVSRLCIEPQYELPARKLTQ